MSNPYRTADTPETIPAQNSSKFPLDIEASDLLVSRDRAALATFRGSSDRTSTRRPKRRTTSANSISRATTDNEE